MPAPQTRAGVLVRMFREVVFFDSLFKASVWTWLFAWLFHAGLVLMLVIHLRYLAIPIWPWIEALIPFSEFASACMFVGLIGLLLRRCLVDRVRVISAPSDYLMLILFIGITMSGIAMRWFTYTNYYEVTLFARGIIQLSPQALPSYAILTIHIVLVCVALLIFPFSKLLHAPGVFFSPSRNQSDNTRHNKSMKSVKSGKSYDE